MEISAMELHYRLFRLLQDGLVIPEYDKIVGKLGEFSKEFGEKRKDIDFWCEKLKELEVCRNALDTGEE